MRSEENALEKFREIVNEAHENGEKTLLIWKNPEEREKLGGNEEEMWVEGAFEVHGFDQDGKAYGNYRSMELTRAIRNAFRCGQHPVRLTTADGKQLIAMAFQIDKLLAMEGHMLFAFRGIFYGHLNGPIVLIPSCRVVEKHVE